MTLSVPPKAWSPVPFWRICLCVLLVALLIYNPFAALTGSSGRVSYEKLARNRASVGASELQHFSPVSRPDVKTEANVDVPSVEPVRIEQEEKPARELGWVLPADPALLSEVWFRPPPSL